ncbi:MAG: carotenoid oxygenase family protein [Polyangiales bacterium]
MNAPAKVAAAWKNPKLAHVGGFEALETEYDYVVPHGEVRGRIPEAVRGTFLRIGPGRNRIGGQKLGHWFDGDGMLHAATFREDGVHYRNRYVRTPKYVKETAAQRIVMRSFGQNAPGGVRKNLGRGLANCANTSMVWHGGRLLCLWEAGRPWEVDPHTLETLGECDFDGKLTALHAFSAHGKLDPRTRCYINFGVGLGPRGPGIHLYRVNPHGVIDRRGYFPVKVFGSFCHDFALTEHYAVFFVSPIFLKRPLAFALGMETFDACMDYDPRKGMWAHVVSLSDFREVACFPLDPFIAIHYANAWEEGNEVVVHVTRFEDWNVNAALRNVFTYENEDGGRLFRYRLDLSTGRVRGEAMPGHPKMEFPQWDPRLTGVKSDVTWAATILENETSGFFNGLERVQHSTGEVRVRDFGPGRFTSEAMFVPDPARSVEEGWLVCAVYDASTHRSEIVLLDAGTLDDVASVPLRNPIPFGFHGGYTTDSL